MRTVPTWKYLPALPNLPAKASWRTTNINHCFLVLNTNLTKDIYYYRESYNYVNSTLTTSNFSVSVLNENLIKHTYYFKGLQ